jgi:hypothetical protein
MNGRMLTTLVAGLVAGGLAAAGCSTGGGGGGGGGSSVSPGIVTSGSLVEGLPAPQYDTNYNFSTAAVNAIPGGRVPALAIAPVNTSVYAANFPGGSVMVVDDQQVTLSGNLFYEAQTMAVDGTRAFAATGNPVRPGAGDLYMNSGTAWSVAFDSPDAEMAVGEGLGTVYAAHGGQGVGGQLLRYDSATNTFSAIAPLNSAIPTAIGESDGRLFVGGSDAFTFQARLQRLDGGSLVDVPVPASGGGRTEITSMVSIATVASGSIAPIVSEVLIIAVGSFDSLGNAISGQVLATDGVSRFELIAGYAGDAPVAVVQQDLGLLIATANGKLQRRDATGVMVDETVPAEVLSFDSAISRNATSVVLGARTATGAKLVRRVGGGVVAGGRDRFYKNDVKTIMQNRCASCHQVGSPVPAATAAMSLTLSAASDTADHTTVSSKVNLAAPASSTLLQKAVGGLAHFGGQVITTGSADYNVLLDWVTQGARLEAVVVTPTFKTYVADIRPIMMGCTSCHNGGGGSFLLSNNLSLNMNDHAEVLQEVNMGTPEASDILRKPTNQGGHGGGTRFGTGSPEYTTILQWIRDGARFQ